jgi:hypothetical protein
VSGVLAAFPTLRRVRNFWLAFGSIVVGGFLGVIIGAPVGSSLYTQPAAGDWNFDQLAWGFWGA